MAQDAHLTCPICAKRHRSVRLAPGERAHCTRCGTVLAAGRRLSAEAPLVFCVTGLILALPASFLPFVSAGNLGAVRVSTLLTGVGALWDNGMRALAVLVLLCGCLMPIALLGTLAMLKLPERLAAHVASAGELARMARAMELCAIPEVQVLAVLVALTKLGSVVSVSIGPGFWCYCAMALSLLLAQRGFDFRALGMETGGEGEPT
jgi:paraquat-inducible protein A